MHCGIVDKMVDCIKVGNYAKRIIKKTSGEKVLSEEILRIFYKDIPEFSQKQG